MRFMTTPRFLCLRALPALLVIIVAALASGADVGYVVLVSIDGFAAYHLDNPKLSLPNIRALAAEGAQAASSETVFPSVTHPAHTTLITGVAPRVHGVLSNRLRHRTTGESFHPTNKLRSESIAVPTLFDAAKRKGLTTAAFFWPETKGDSAIDYNLPETLDVEQQCRPDRGRASLPGGAAAGRCSDRPLLRVVPLAGLQGGRRRGSGAGGRTYDPRTPSQPACHSFSRDRRRAT